MKSLVENLEEAVRVNARLEELIRDGHSLIKTLRATQRELNQDLEALVDKHTGDNLAPLLENMTKVVKERLDQSVEHIMSEFSKVSDPILATMDLIDEHQKKGGFFG